MSVSIYRLNFWVVITLITLLNIACSGSIKPTKPVAITVQPGVSAKELLHLASQRPSPERERLMLEASQVYFNEEKFSSARDLLLSMNSDSLIDKDFIIYTDLLSNIALQEGSHFLAQSALTKPRLEKLWVYMEPVTEITLRDKRAGVFNLLGEYQRSVNERIQLSALLNTDEDQVKNQTALWQSLTNMPMPELQTLGKTERSLVTRAWYQLAAIGKNNQTDLEQQLAQLQSWMSDWPAKNNLPADLQLLQSLIEKQPKKIALLLPQQGKLAEAGDAVRDGFFAAYYLAVNRGRQTPEVRQYDTSKDVLLAYQQAVTEGADLIIGPIEKEKVTELSLMPSLEVPVLSLNYTDTANNLTITNLYQFGLAVEDEARQAARQAFLDGHRQAMIIVPAQEWAERSSQAFATEWQILGGTIVNRSQFQVTGKISNTYAKTIKDALLIDESQTRSEQIQNFLGSKVEIAPRRRSDVDMIFLIATPDQARQIKPTFAFHYAGDIPVYATSHIYSGEPNIKADGDLNGIRFTTMPWTFDKAIPEKQQIGQYTKSAAVYGRLHALGVDVFRLYARLPQLEQGPQMRLFGTTGTLGMQPDRRIEREQIWVQFNKGRALPLPKMITDNRSH
jgi:uncharacterized protein